MIVVQVSAGVTHSDRSQQRVILRQANVDVSRASADSIVTGANRPTGEFSSFLALPAVQDALVSSSTRLQNV